MSNVDDMDNVKAGIMDTVFGGEDMDTTDDTLDLDDTNDHSDDLDNDDDHGDDIDNDDHSSGSDTDRELDAGGEQDKSRDKRAREKEKMAGQTRNDPKQTTEDVSLSPQEIVGKYDVDKAGNVVINGQIIARSGPERKIFEKFRNTFEEVNRQQHQMVKHIQDVVAAGKELKQKYDTLRENRGYGERIGLDDAETKQALDIAALAKNDPKAAAKKFLTLMQLSGTTIDDIGTEVPLDPATIAEQAVQKYVAEQEAKAKKEATTEPVESPEAKEAREWLDRNPKAVPFVQQLDQAKSRFPHLSYDQCWTLLQQGIDRAKKNADQQDRQRAAPKDPGTSQKTRTRRRQPPKSTIPDSAKSFKQIGADLLRELNSKE